MGWLAFAGRILLACALALLAGWFYGAPLLAVTIFLVGVIGFWIYQMRKTERWLRAPEEPPPDSFGIWGELSARMYSHQRRNEKVRQELQANLTYLQESFAAMRDGVVMLDEQGSIKWFNTAVEPLLGLRYPDDSGQVLTNLVRNPDFNAYFAGRDYTRPLQYVAEGETQRHLRVEITHFGAGERLLFIRDVSDAVRLEQIRRDFVANVSHELRTPLTVITGYLGTFMAQQSELPATFEKPLRQMSQQADRMENLLKDLLWLSRIESEKSDVKRGSVDMCGLLQELVEEYSDTHPGRQIELKLDTDSRIQGDYRELYSALSNLLSNALKYSPESEPVSINWYCAQNKCIVEVRDRGIGIDSLHLPRLTERFYRVDDSRSSSTGGTGLGLAIVKHVMAAHEGELQIDSELGA
ncbi:MAG: phosphate regulon sensor histidine kinase PhoR, partial [Halioglobus sp.]|nr:phosphate regulon sensor histidine kinase PhoR [Halioglobus sp.]